jgi:hypothetical protein
VVSVPQPALRYSERMGIGARPVVVIAATLVLACGAREGEQERFSWVDEKGRRCTQTKYGQFSTCEGVEPKPSKPCTDGATACFVMHVPKPDAGASLAPSMMWNCDACCAQGAPTWSGSTADCAAVTCKSAKDCLSEDGQCEDGRCTSKRF